MSISIQSRMFGRWYLYTAAICFIRLVLLKFLNEYILIVEIIFVRKIHRNYFVQILTTEDFTHFVLLEAKQRHSSLLTV